MTNYQNYNHYKLPITLNPLEYGRLIFSNKNTYIMWITTKTICVITQYATYNEIKFYRDGEFRFSYIDEQISQKSFIRKTGNKQFSFNNYKLSNIISNIEN